MIVIIIIIIIIIASCFDHVALIYFASKAPVVSDWFISFLTAFTQTVVIFHGSLHSLLFVSLSSINNPKAFLKARRRIKQKVY